MILLDHPIWAHLLPYASLDAGRENLDFLGLPEQLWDLAVHVVVNCVACGNPIHPVRARMKSERSRAGGPQYEWRLFYASTCPTYENAGCSRTHAAAAHKERMIEALKARGVAA